MKKTIFSLALLALIATVSFAQSTFTEATLNQIHQAFVDNPSKAVAERTLPDFTMVGANGVADYTRFKALNDGGGLQSWPTSEIKVKQGGSIAIVKGITKHSPKGTNIVYNQRFTEIYEFQKGTWMLASAHYTDIVPSKADEEAAIKKAIEGEAHEFHFNSDRSAFLKSWNFVDGSIMLYSGKTGLTRITGKDMKAAAENGQIPKADNQKTTFLNYVIRVGDGVAWATFDQGGDKAVVTHEFRCLEKVGNDWKIVSSSVHDTR